jgi:hypothetical protein
MCLNSQNTEVVEVDKVLKMKKVSFPSYEGQRRMAKKQQNGKLHRYLKSEFGNDEKALWRSETTVSFAS